MKNKIISVVLVLVIAFLIWYVMLPPLNLSSPIFWTYLLVLIVIAAFVMMPSIAIDLIYNKKKRQSLSKGSLIAVKVAFGVMLLIAVINIFTLHFLIQKCGLIV